jgi:rhodanese-related sulfurtransferase
MRKLLVVVSVFVVAAVCTAGWFVPRTLWYHELRTRGEEISTDQLKAMMGDGAMLRILDVRFPFEYDDGHIPGAELKPLDKISHWAPKLEKDERVVLVCKIGRRSEKAAAELVGRGHSNVYILRKAMMGWDGPVERSKVQRKPSFGDLSGVFPRRSGAKPPAR